MDSWTDDALGPKVTARRRSVRPRSPTTSCSALRRRTSRGEDSGGGDGGDGETEDHLLYSEDLRRPRLEPECGDVDRADGGEDDDRGERNGVEDPADGDGGDGEDLGEVAGPSMVRTGVESEHLGAHVRNRS